MYYVSRKKGDEPVRLFKFPHTLAGDAALSILIQCVLTWFIMLWLVNRNLRSALVQPIGFLPEPHSRILRWFMFLDQSPAGRNRMT